MEEGTVEASSVEPALPRENKDDQQTTPVNSNSTSNSNNDEKVSYI